jgi:hypothetical protein
MGRQRHDLSRFDRFSQDKVGKHLGNASISFFGVISQFRSQGDCGGIQIGCPLNVPLNLWITILRPLHSLIMRMKPIMRNFFLAVVRMIAIIRTAKTPCHPLNQKPVDPEISGGRPALMKLPLG